jgi:hypothetical protein
LGGVGTPLGICTYLVIDCCSQEAEDHNTQEFHQQTDCEGPAGDGLVVSKQGTAGTEVAKRKQVSQDEHRG